MCAGGRHLTQHPAAARSPLSDSHPPDRADIDSIRPEELGRPRPAKRGTDKQNGFPARIHVCAPAPSAEGRPFSTLSSPFLLLPSVAERVWPLALILLLKL